MQAETASRMDESRAMLAAVFDNNPNAILVVDETGRIVRANPRTLALFGYAPETLLGQPVEVLLPERCRGRHTHHRAAFFAAPRQRAMDAGIELFGRRADGFEFPVGVMVSPMRWGTQTLAGSGTASVHKALLLLLDLNLPDMSGVHIMKPIKASAPLRRIPIVILTTADDKAEVERCHDLDCNVYVTKPVSYEAFANAIRQLGLFSP
jgi:PAS domain S-box-containing protein